MAADIEEIILVTHRAADAAHEDLVLLDHEHAAAFLGELIGGGEACGACANDDGVKNIGHENLYGKVERVK